MTARSPISAPGPAQADASAAAALMVAAMLAAPGLDIIAKLLLERLPPAQVGTGRFLAQSVLMLPIVLAAGQWCLPGRLHVLGGALMGLCILCINMAVREMPVANAIAIFFVEPLLLTLLAAAFLGERLGRLRLIAIGLGLVGTLVVLRPNWSAYGTTAIWPLAAAACFSGYMLVTRIMSQRGGRLALQFWTGAFAMLALGLLTGLGAAAGGGMGVVPLWPTVRELALFGAIGLLAAIVHQLIAIALARSEAGALAPYQYLEILSATGLGWLIFGDFPDAMTGLGAAMIVGAGLYLFSHERRATRIAPVPPA